MELRPNRGEPEILMSQLKILVVEKSCRNRFGFEVIFCNRTRSIRMFLVIGIDGVNGAKNVFDSVECEQTVTRRNDAAKAGVLSYDRTP